ncbi:hypothetical protein BD408DRAFT_442307 [Parasitella parasitica]|nr:hypothetical protein BD408DRAFT_442307 [Parasitella parasitica]
MSESGKDHDSKVVMPQPLVPESESNRTYIFQISDDEGQEDTIERMYGPFENAIETAPPYPARFARTTKNAYMIRTEQILKLREAIKDREERQAQNLLKKKKQEIQEGLDATARKRGKRITVKAAASSSSARPDPIPPAVSAAKVDATAPTELIVIDSDSDDSMQVDATETDTVMTSNEASDSRSSAAVVSAKEPYTSSERDDSDEDSFETALDIGDDIDLELQQMQQDRSTTQEEIQELNRELEAQSSRKSDINLKLLGIRVKLSIEKNRKEPKKKEATPTRFSPSPKLGSKRPHTNGDHFVNKNLWRPTAPPLAPPLDYIPTITAHDITGLTMPFAQQIPPHIQHYPHLQTLHPEQSMPRQALYTNRYSFYMNPPPPPPPPPDTMPPPHIPPPPPPLNPPRYKRTRYTRRHNDTRHTLNALSPYADLHSPISRMENAEELQAALVYVSELISVRIFGDSKHDAYPANVVRNLPKPRRLVTADKRSSASSTNALELGDDIKDKTVFLSPAGLPVKLEISDTYHESPLLGLLYRKYHDKPFTNVMEFVVPSIFSWIPKDVDLSTLYSNEYGGLSLYADRLVETYNMVCDLSIAYPTTEFIAALKLEMSMYVNGRESEHFMRDCQDCVRQFPDSIDVFWQIVLAESDQTKQISLIKEQLRSIKLSCSTVTMVISEKATEILIRTMRLFGLGQVLKLLTDDKISEISDAEDGMFSLDQIQYVNDDGKYFIWMSILHYYVTKALPANVCDVWMTSLVKDGTPSREKPLFTIDWGNALKGSPVDRSTLRGSINILLSMLRYFGNSAIRNVNKKPLLVGVLSTLFSFLSFTKSYELIGTIVLTQQLNSPSILRDIEEIRTDLTSKMDV